MKFLAIILYRAVKTTRTFVLTIFTRLIIQELGKGSRVNSACRFPPETRIGEDCHFNGTTVLGRGGLTIGNHFHSGLNLVILTDTHNFRSEVLPYDDTFIKGPVSIGDHVWVGVNVTILPGVRVGDRAIIGAGSVVTKDVPSSVIVGGNPAAVIGSR